MRHLPQGGVCLGAAGAYPSIPKTRHVGTPTRNRSNTTTVLRGQDAPGYDEMRQLASTAICYEMLEPKEF